MRAFSGSVCSMGVMISLLDRCRLSRRKRKRKYRLGDIGFHHYAFELRSRKDVDALQDFLQDLGATIVDPAGEYYDDYYAVFFLDPDGLKLEGMKYGERRAREARKRAAAQ